MSTNETLRELSEILEQRKSSKADESYVASLYASGLEKILSKISEEARETVDAARENDVQHLIHEVADLSPPIGRPSYPGSNLLGTSPASVGLFRAA